MKFLLITAVICVISVIPGNACRCNTEVDEPICGSDGKTYKNACLFICSKHSGGFPAPPAQVLHKGECDTASPACGCPFYFDPMCGSDGQSWPNECMLNCAKTNADAGDEIRKNLSVASKGTCGNPCNCDDPEALVCGSDNVTYKNRCVIDCVINNPYGKFTKLTVKQDGKC